MPRLFSNISDSILQSLNESVYEENKKVKNAKKQYNVEPLKKPRIMKGTVDTENVGSTKSIEKKIERTPYVKPHKATKKVVAEGEECEECDKQVEEADIEGTDPRPNETKLLNLLDNESVDPVQLARELMSYLSDDDIKRFMEVYEYEEVPVEECDTQVKECDKPVTEGENCEQEIEECDIKEEK